MKESIEYRPVTGKTYSLFNRSASTQAFYGEVAGLTDRFLGKFSFSEKQLLEYIERASSNKTKLRRNARSNPGESILAGLLQACHEILGPYMTGIESHLRSTARIKWFTDRELLTTREQYYLYMVEFEIVNRLHIKDFRESDFRIALLPYCLKETHSDCKARKDELDYRCKGCLKTCYINRVSSILREYGINPYILSRGRVGSLLNELQTKYGKIGVLGIACIVELVMGMRLCMKAGVPVVGLPLNANRCPRWMGEMHDTSFDLKAVVKLLNETSMNKFNP